MSKKDKKDKKKRPELKVKITPENKCSFCTGTICCSYVTQQIDAPRSKYDFEHLLWQVSHENVSAYKEEDGWYLMFTTRCTHLLDDGRCGIYETRPEVCREYSNDYCEYDSPAEEGFELYFRDYDELLKYCKKRFKRWKRG
ncbi:MAG: YkgJ family cysteine cluster protein [Chromatiales bacterium]|nr:YkgJ family cysteine cluster protein [Chromatiales bacterium]